MRLTRAVTHIRRCDANHAKIAALDAVAAAYLQLCQQYTTYFCTEADPDKYATPCFASPLSQRWQRVAIQHASGTAQSWRTKYTAAYHDCLDRLAEYREDTEPEGELPQWKDWQTPVLKAPVMQANANVALLQPSQNSSFEYWLRLSTLEHGHPAFLPVKRADYHRQALAGRQLARSTTLARKPAGWWLTLSYEERGPVATLHDAPVIGGDVGIANFRTTSDGQQYGTFPSKLATRRRTATLRACLTQTGGQHVPVTRTRKLARHVHQERNRAVTHLYADHPAVPLADEPRHVAGRRVKARGRRASRAASTLAHLPRQRAGGAATRGIRARKVLSACSSDGCARGHFVSRQNRPTRQPFCGAICGQTTHAEVPAAGNLASRLHDQELAACAERQTINALLDRRHQAWRETHTGWP
jgi:hypothetical protein